MGPSHCKMITAKTFWIWFWEHDLSHFSFSKQQKDKAGVNNEVCLPARDESVWSLALCSFRLRAIRDTQHCWTHEWVICWRMNAVLCGEHPIPLSARCSLLGCWSMHTYTLTHYTIILKNGHILWLCFVHLISDSRWQNALNPKSSELLTKTAFEDISAWKLFPKEG